MFYIGVDLGGTGIKVGLVDENGNIVAKDSMPTRAQEGYIAIAEDMATLIGKVLEQSGHTVDECKCIGIGCPGSVDDKNGVVYYSNNINMSDAPIADEVRKHIDLPVFVGNDANCAALGEYFALDDPEATSMVAVTLGTGVGSGIIIDGRIFTGFNGVAGELGHTMLHTDGEDCTCGRKGCWEAYASATALIRDTERAAKQHPNSLVAKMVAENGGKASGRTAFDADRAGDAVGTEVKNNYIRYVAEGIVDIINTLRPHVVLIGGGISKEGDNLLLPIREYADKYVYGAGTVPATDIRIAKLGNDAGIVGAAFLGK